MDTNLLISKAAEYTEKFVNAALPVAKQAYEIGLLTIQIDAIQSIVTRFIFLGLWIFLAVYIAKFIKNYDLTKLPVKSEHKYDQEDQTLLYRFIKTGMFIALIPILLCICNVWIWIKLFKPELWLAKQAIDAVLSVAK